MRQAGRILKPYRDLRQRHGSIQKLFTTPELAAEITLMPIELLGVDAAILFTDLVTPLEPLGCEFTYDPGPVFTRPMRSADDIRGLRRVEPEQDLDFVLETIRLVRNDLPTTVPLIGYAGAPFTLATWVVQGGGSKDFPAFRGMLHADPQLAHQLLEKITDLVIRYLQAQIKAGAQAIQLFDTSVGLLSPTQFSEFALPYLQQICSELASLQVPIIYFPLGAAQNLAQFAHVGADVLSLDWRIDIEWAFDQLGDAMPLQGNLDPCSLYGSEEAVIKAASDILDKTRGRPHIFNLGHGVYPDTPYEMVRLLVETVHHYAKK
jgi:uroporphyrinogen decarboxylase